MNKWLASLCILMFLAGPSLAHKVSIFAWVEGDTVHTQSKFSGGKLVRQGAITVFDGQENKLLEGVTNDQGEFSFSIPQKTALHIVLGASMGHGNTWTIPLSEIKEAMGEEAVTTKAPAISLMEQQAPVTPATQENNQKIIQASMEKALDKKLQPLTRMMLEAREDKPDLADILGGIGYIIGLAGLAAYMHYRRKIKELEEA